MGKVVILENLDFMWDYKDIEKVKTLWSEGKNLEYITKEVKRIPDETFLLLLDLARRGKIKGRKRGVYGF